MKAFSVIGISKTGKTTVIENIISELKKRNYSVGTIKNIHFEKFAMDIPGTNTDRHRQAGADLVTARGINETDILFPGKLSISEILSFYHHDYVIMEGVKDYNLPKILTASGEEEIKQQLDRSVFAISGIVSNEFSGSYMDIPVINPLNDIKKLVDLIEKKVYEILPDFPENCCSECGYNCRELGYRILKGDSERTDCVISDGSIELYIGEEKINMVPFVQEILRDTIEAVVKNLKGYHEGKEIKIHIGWRK